MGEYAEEKGRQSRVESIAEACHEMNRAYCQATGDLSQAPWADAPDWQKDSARKGVELHLENPETTPEQSHISWLEVKTAAGWKYGPVKDNEKKEHPCFMPYAQLPAEAKVKDFLFKATVDITKKLT